MLMSHVLCFGILCKKDFFNIRKEQVKALVEAGKDQAETSTVQSSSSLVWAATKYLLFGL